MGTRHHIVVTDRDGVLKVRQFGNSDGYFDGKGVRMLGMISQPGFLDALEQKLLIVQALPEDDPKIARLLRETTTEDPELKKLHSWTDSSLSYKVLERIVNSDEPEILLVQDGPFEAFSYHLNYKDRTWTATHHYWNRNFSLTYSIDELPTMDEFMTEVILNPKEAAYHALMGNLTVSYKVDDLERRRFATYRLPNEDRQVSCSF